MKELHIINLPDPRDNYEAYRRAQDRARAQGMALEQLLTKEAEARGWKVVRVIAWDFGRRWSVEVEDAREPAPVHDLHQIAN